MQIQTTAEILNQEHFDKVAAFAVEAGKAESLQESLDQLQRIADNFSAKIHIGYDFAPYSLSFSIDKGEGEDRRTVLNGGVIFHGSHDGGGNGGAPTYSVNLNPVDGWSIHT
ncbi:MAG TPA: DUF4120 family protein [Anaerolineae bacterium]|nr:DUF4120 family protein [Anaerolineae bacterium]